MWKGDGNHWIILEHGDLARVCFNKTITHSVGLWKVENALLSTLPLFFLQLAIIMPIIYLLRLLLSRFHQPRIVAHIIGGVIMGPSLIGRTNLGQDYIFQFKNMLTAETLANLGLIYYMFVLGLQVDSKLILQQARKKVTCITIVGILFPLSFGYLLYKFLTLNETPPPTTPGKVTRLNKYGPMVWGIALANTNFPELTGVLANARLLHSELGQTALSISFITDFISWIMHISLVVAMSDGEYLRVLSTFVLILLFVFAFRPALSWLVRYTNNSYDMDDQICFIMAGVLLFGFISDACGAHSILGAFLMGAIVPNGDLKNAIIEKVEDFVWNVMMPLFFLIVGMRMQVQAILIRFKDIMLVVPLVIMAFLAKFLITFLASAIINNKMPLRDSLALGILLNTKGVLSLIIINSGRNLKVLNNHTYAVILTANLAMTVAVGPMVAQIYKKANGACSQYQKHRSMRSIEPNSEFRVLTCIHSTTNISGIIKLLKATNPTKQSPISVFSVHLVDLSSDDNSSPMLIMHDKLTTSAVTTTTDKNATAANHIVSAFEKFETENQQDSVSVEAITSMSGYSSMHEDICILARDKRVDLIIVPFHEQYSRTEEKSPSESIRDVNRNILDNAPCSVAVFVDRYRGSDSDSKDAGSHIVHPLQRCVMLFIGGPDDREALAYAWRLASNNPNITLTVVRFVGRRDVNNNDNDHVNNEVKEEDEKEKQVDEEYIESFMVRSRDQPSIKLTNEVVNYNGEENMCELIISSMGSGDHNYQLYIVGREQRVPSSALSTVGLSELGDCPELGPLGHALITCSFLMNASILCISR